MGGVEVRKEKADSSLTTPEPTPKSKSLFGAPGTFGAPFAQNDSVREGKNAHRRGMTSPTFTANFRVRRLGDFDYVAAGCCCGIGALDEFLRNRVELRGLRTLGAGQCYGKSAVSAFTNGGDQFDRHQGTGC